MVRFVASDIDGTLLHDHADRICPEYFPVIRKLAEKGIRFCAASGRQYKSMVRLFEPVKDHVFYIPENGAETVCGGERIFAMPMTMEASRQLVLDTRKIPGAESMYCTGDTAYFEKGDTKVYTLMKETYHFHCTQVEDLLELDEPCLKFSLFLPERVKEITAEWFVPKWKHTHEVACGGKYFMDVMERGANKGTALRRLADRLGIAKEEMVVFGDNQNDLEMFREAGTSYAVSNAANEIRLAADQVIRSNNEDGVLEKLKELI